MTDWLLRVGDAQNFNNSSKYGIWGIDSSTSNNKYFIRSVTPEDRLWFVENNTHGRLVAVATYGSHRDRKFSNEQLGWSGTDWTSDVEVHYTELYELSHLQLLTHIKSPRTVRIYNEKCKVDLPVEYYNSIALSFPAPIIDLPLENEPVVIETYMEAYKRAATEPKPKKEKKLTKAQKKDAIMGNPDLTSEQKLDIVLKMV